jgi:hypothetical protein
MVRKGNNSSRSMDQFTPLHAVKNCDQLYLISGLYEGKISYHFFNVDNGKFYEMCPLCNAEQFGL